MINTKCCKICLKDLDINNFNKSNGYYRSNCKTCQNEIGKKYREINKNNSYYQIYYQNNKKDLNIYNKEYKIKNNIGQYIQPKEYWSSYQKTRRLKDSLFKLKGNIRNLIKNSIKGRGTKKNSKTANILGCTFQEFKEHLEKQFDDKMNWDNHGKYWHIDHIKPISLAITEQEIIELNHYTNFQPLERIENIKKGKKF